MIVDDIEFHYTVPELANLARVNKSTIYYWQHTGYGPPAIRVGKRLLFRKSDVAKWLQERAEAAS